MRFIRLFGPLDDCISMTGWFFIAYFCFSVHAKNKHIDLILRTANNIRMVLLSVKDTGPKDDRKKELFLIAIFWKSTDNHNCDILKLNKLIFSNVTCQKSFFPI